MKQIKYKITDVFGSGDAEPGDIIWAILICEDRTHGLVFHPKDKASHCASIDICRNEGEYWESADDAIFVNIPPVVGRLFEKLLGKELTKMSNKLVQQEPRYPRKNYQPKVQNAKQKR